MIAKRIDGDTTYFRVFSGRIIFRDKRLNFVAHRLVYGALACNRGEPSGFRATTCLFDCSPLFRTDSSQLGCAFTLCKRAV
jgi:hypothetical protein